MMMHGRNLHHGRSREPWFTGIHIRPILFCQRRRLIGPQGRRLPEPCQPRTREAGTRLYKVPRTEGRGFAAIRLHGRKNALSSWVAAILRIWGTLLVPCGSTVARNSILAEVDKSCKREKIKILQSGKSPADHLDLAHQPPADHSPSASPPPTHHHPLTKVWNQVCNSKRKGAVLP